MPDDYSTQKHMYYAQEARKIIQNDLPPFCADYFRSMLNNTTPLTRYVYAVDIRLFFNYILNENDAIRGKNIKDVKASDMEKITPTDIELFLEYVSMYSRDIISVDDDGEVKVT